MDALKMRGSQISTQHIADAEPEGGSQHRMLAVVLVTVRPSSLEDDPTSDSLTVESLALRIAEKLTVCAAFRLSRLPLRGGVG